MGKRFFKFTAVNQFRSFFAINVRCFSQKVTVIDMLARMATKAQS